MAKIIVKRGTAAQVAAAAAAGQLTVGELYYITNSGKLAIGASPSSYTEYMIDSGDIARTTVINTWSATQLSNLVIQASLSISLAGGNKFKVTPTAGGVLTFTSLSLAGAGGIIIFVNTGNYAITAASTTKVPAGFLSTISATGTYTISYESDGTNVYCSCTGAQS